MEREQGGRGGVDSHVASHTFFYIRKFSEKNSISRVILIHIPILEFLEVANFAKEALGKSSNVYLSV